MPNIIKTINQPSTMNPESNSIATTPAVVTAKTIVSVPTSIQATPASAPKAQNRQARSAKKQATNVAFVTAAKS